MVGIIEDSDFETSAKPEPSAALSTPAGKKSSHKLATSVSTSVVLHPSKTPKKGKIHTQPNVPPTSIIVNPPFHNNSDPVDDLPSFARSAWKTHFLPTVYSHIGSHMRPFDAFTGQGVEKEIQTLVDLVYPNSGYTVKHGTRLYSMVCSSVCLNPSAYVQLFLGMPTCMRKARTFRPTCSQRRRD